MPGIRLKKPCTRPNESPFFCLLCFQIGCGSSWPWPSVCFQAPTKFHFEPSSCSFLFWVIFNSQLSSSSSPSYSHSWRREAFFWLTCERVFLLLSWTLAFCLEVKAHIWKALRFSSSDPHILEFKGTVAWDLKRTLFNILKKLRGPAILKCCCPPGIHKDWQLTPFFSEYVFPKFPHIYSQLNCA